MTIERSMSLSEHDKPYTEVTSGSDDDHFHISLRIWWDGKDKLMDEFGLPAIPQMVEAIADVVRAGWPNV